MNKKINNMRNIIKLSKKLMWENINCENESGVIRKRIKEMNHHHSSSNEMNCVLFF